MNINFKSIVDFEEDLIVVCNLEHIITYMNQSAIKGFESDGGAALIGKSVLDCHNPHSNEIIKRIVKWFKLSKDNNLLHSYSNENARKDTYIGAVRDENGELTGYYERQVNRNVDKNPVNHNV